MSRTFRKSLVALVAVICLVPFGHSAEPEATCDQLLQQIAQLSRRVAILEAQVKARQQTVVPATPAPPGARPAVRQEPTGIDPIYGQIDQLLADGKIDEAQKLLTDRKATGEKSATINTLTREMAVVGKPTPSWAIEKWFQGEGDVDLDSGQPTLIVFWEAWCPHCKNELPRLQKVYEDYKSRGLRVVGLTRLTRNSTEEAVMNLIAEKQVSYPVAKETGDVAAYFNVKGIPAAAVVKDGKVIWRGHPLRLTDEILERWL